MKARMKIRSLTTYYLIICGILSNTFLIVTITFRPDITWKIREKIEDKISAVFNISNNNSNISRITLADEIYLNFDKWVPSNKKEHITKNNIVNSSDYPSLQLAADDLITGDTFLITEGSYKESLIIIADDINIIGVGHVVLDGVAAEGKGAIINKGDFNRYYNIECHSISVQDRNGACIRHEGSNLILDHIYFHDSQQGILTGNNPGVIEITDSRFENLGQNGRAHAIYTNGGELYIRNSLVIASKDEGHEIKSRSSITSIINSTIASLSSKDSRLIDVPAGGVFILKNSTLQQGYNSSNQDSIGYALEENLYKKNSIHIEKNLILLERKGTNKLIHTQHIESDIIISGNVIIGENLTQEHEGNIYINSRKEYGIDKLTNPIK